VREGEENRSDRDSRLPVFPETTATSRLPGREPISAKHREAPDSHKAKKDFERNYPSDPDGAVWTLLGRLCRWEGATALEISPVQAAAILLSHLPGASYGRQNLLVDALKHSVGPHAIVQGALTVSYTPSGPDILQAAAGLLEHFASDAWPTLERLAASDRPECRYFVRQTAACDGIAESLRIQALARLALNPDPDTRREVAEALESGFVNESAAVWGALAVAQQENIRRPEAITE
jgi:hypothetical protein